MANTSLEQIAGISTTTNGISADTVQQTQTLAAPKQQQQEKAKANVEPKFQAEPSELEKLQIEIAKAQLEALKLQQEEAIASLQEKRLNMQDIQDRLNDRKLKTADHGQKAYANGAALADANRVQKGRETKCNHRKGGNGQAGYVGGQGDDSQYAVMKHTLCNGDVNVRCMRCGKTWKPPIAEDFGDDREAYLDAYADYKAACAFPTRNSPSSSVLFGYSDGGKFYREQTRHTTLR
jgi:hypothetical protein